MLKGADPNDVRKFGPGEAQKYHRALKGPCSFFVFVCLSVFVSVSVSNRFFASVSVSPTKGPMNIAAGW
jgi:hypothetical protein